MKLSPTVTVGVTVFSSIFRLDNVRWQFFSYLQIPMKTEPLHHPLCINSQLLESGGNTIGPESEIVFQLRCLAPNTCSLRFFPLIISNLVAYFREKKKIGPRMSSKNSVQFSSFSQSCPTLCDPMNRSTPVFPVHHQLPEFTQTHVHWVGDAIHPSNLLSSPSPPAPNPSQHQGLFQWVNCSHEVVKVLEFQL